MQTTIVSANWLYDHMQDPDLVILDASQSDNVSGLTPQFEGKYIPNARFFDLKKVFSDQESHLPNTIPSVQAFEEGVRNLGVSNHSKIVVYDNLGVYFSPRVRFLFKVMGHHNVAVLDGGLSAWIAAGYETTLQLDSEAFEEGEFKATFLKELVVSAKDVFHNINSQQDLVIDVRSSKRFEGSIPEPRQGIRSGHIPKSLNLPFKEVLHEGRYKLPEDIQKAFKQAGIVSDQPYVFTCGSGLTACIVMLASEIANKNRVKVYDGSWTEWGQSEYPIEKD
ncbi:sulfurtransferase [Zhouia amylolytica]|nr:sulfurtransferase [Zhouia amylolytica]